MADARTDRAYDTGYHAPVMVREVCDLLGVTRLAASGTPLRMLDCTLGGGGHAAALLDSGADVTGLDRDPQAIAEALRRLATFAAAGRFRAVAGNFADPPLPTPDSQLPTGNSRLASPDSQLWFDGILLDLGVSSHQFDDPARGFSFREGAPLDMRMDGAAADGETAAHYLNTSDEATLAAVFREFGDERKATRLAREVLHRRASRPFATSDDLVGAIRAVLGPRSGPPEFARLFQAVRIAVNDELGGLTRALPALRDRLAPWGVIAVITYHSGEDRLVKHTFREWSRSCICPPKHPVCTCGDNHALGDVVTRKPLAASPDEVARNARARSAHLRAWRRSGPASTTAAAATYPRPGG